jgi:hypothetical protein
MLVEPEEETKKKQMPDQSFLASLFCYLHHLLPLLPPSKHTTIWNGKF